MQLALNVFLFSGVMYILWSFWSTIRSDVDKKSSEAIAELMAEMAVCARQYTENRCAPETRVPAMGVVCDNWEKCMNRDTTRVARARVSAHTFAEIFNSFLEPISYKAMVRPSIIHYRFCVSADLLSCRSSPLFWSLAVWLCRMCHSACSENTRLLNRLLRLIITITIFNITTLCTIAHLISSNTLPTPDSLAPSQKTH